MKSTGCILLLLVASTAFAAAKSYYGYKLLRLSLNTASQVQLLQSFQNDYVEIDFWKEPALHHKVDMNVPAHLLKLITDACEQNDIQLTVLQDNLQSLIDTNGPSRPQLKHLSELASQLHSDTPVSRSAVYSDIVGTFPRHNDVLAWLDGLANIPGSEASVYDIGQTFEGRTMTVIKMTAGAVFGTKPVIWVDSGIHAREWLTVGTTIWIINKLLTSNNNDVRRMMEDYEWHFLPVANPDGYEYTHTSDRLWRKTRKASSRWCFGVDPNRNWDFHFGESGTSTDPCSDTYRGERAFSEPCVINMKNAIQDQAPYMKMYMGIHSYSQLLLTPWAYGSPPPADHQELDYVATVGADAIYSMYRKNYIVGPPPAILYAASGGAYDWVKGVAGVKYSYTYELRPDGNAYNGFVVPESEIEESGEEIFASLVAMIDAI